MLYSRAPIIEAIIDFRTNSALAPSMTLLDVVHSKVQSRFPQKETLSRDDVKIQHSDSEGKPGPVVDAKRTFAGYRLIGDAGRKILSVTVDGFGFSVLPPYDKWSTFRDEARELWGIYKSICTPTQIKRIAVRYINRFDFPYPKIELTDYLKLYPEAPSSYFVRSYFMQLQLPQPDIDAMAVINQTSAPPTSKSSCAIIFDIDLFGEKIIVDAKNDTAAWDYLERLRDRKNSIFEDCITDKTRELIT